MHGQLPTDPPSSSDRWDKLTAVITEGRSCHIKSYKRTFTSKPVTQAHKWSKPTHYQLSGKWLKYSCVAVSYKHLGSWNYEKCITLICHSQRYRDLNGFIISWLNQKQSQFTNPVLKSGFVNKHLLADNYRRGHICWYDSTENKTWTRFSLFYSCLIGLGSPRIQDVLLKPIRF